jgi:16S rRNA (uracil1498-N3)-methyltransferase
MGRLLGAVLRRYWISTEDLQNGSVRFVDENFHHIFSVCRQDKGSKFEVLTEQSKAYLVEVTEVGKKSAVARVLEERDISPLPTPHIHLALSVSRFPVMDAVVEKAVEMGVKSIAPFFSEFSFVRHGDKISPAKFERWGKIIKSATQQSGRGDLMRMQDPIDLTKVWPQINLNAKNWGLFAYEGAATRGIKEHFAQIRSKPTLPTGGSPDPDEKPASPENIWIFVGSEGGFSYQEVEDFKMKGLEPVTLGSQVLRVETACIALVSALKYEFDLMR